MLVELTHAGLNLLDEAVAANTKSGRALLGDLSAKEIATLGKLLRKMLAALEPGETSHS